MDGGGDRNQRSVPPYIYLRRLLLALDVSTFCGALVMHLLNFIEDLVTLLFDIEFLNLQL